MMRSLSEPWFVPMRIAIAALLAEHHQRREPFADALQFGRVLLVGVFLDGEFLGVREVARVDAHFLHPLGRFHGGVGLEMDVGHDGHLAAAFAQARFDELQVARVLDRRRGDADDLAADRGQVERLLDARGSVHRVAGDHRLDAHRVVAADADAAHAHLTGAPAADGTGGLQTKGRGHGYEGSRTYAQI